MPNFTQISYSVCILIIRFLALNLPEAEDSGCVARGRSRGSLIMAEEWAAHVDEASGAWYYLHRKLTLAYFALRVLSVRVLLSRGRNH